MGIVVGSVVDGVPESLIFGIQIGTGAAISLSFLAAVFVSNIPQAIAPSADLVKAGWKAGRSRCSGRRSCWPAASPRRSATWRPNGCRTLRRPNGGPRRRRPPRHADELPGALRYERGKEWAGARRETVVRVLRGWWSFLFLQVVAQACSTQGGKLDPRRCLDA